MAPLFDAHNHLQDEWLAPHRDRIYADLASAGVRAGVVNGTSESDWTEVAVLCASGDRPPVGGVPSPRHPIDSSSQLSTLNSQLQLLPSFGLHPWDVGNRTTDWREKLIRVVDATPNACVGEIGLDRWMTDRAKPDDPRLAGLRRAPLEEQLEVFHAQLVIASERNCPATIHCLDAFGALLDALQKGPVPARGFLLHAYSGPVEMVPSFAKLGARFSFNGAFIEPRKERLRELFAKIPPERLLVETDAPAMSLPLDREQYALPNSPDNRRVNHPANVVVAYQALAEIRQMPFGTLTELVAENFDRLFGR